MGLGLLNSVFLTTQPSSTSDCMKREKRDEEEKALCVCVWGGGSRRGIFSPQPAPEGRRAAARPRSMTAAFGEGCPDGT